jgi:hypothetical protein
MWTDMDTFYRRLVRVQGWYAFAFLPVTALALPGAIADGRFLVVTTILTFVAGVVALKLALPRRSPRWLTQPAHALQGLAGALTWGVLALLFLVATLGTMILLGLPDPLATTLTMAAAAAHVVMCGIAAALAAGLGLSARSANQPAHTNALAA